jgi:hypothetical protein
MPIIGKTYYCGDEGKLKVYDHATSIWTDKSISGSPTFYDVKADPTNPNEIILGGLGYLSRSVDSGTTLVTCTGNWSAYTPTIYRISYTNNNSIIYTAGMGGVAKSTDGGVSFNRLNSFTAVIGLQCLAIHFINDLVGIASQESKLYKTIDGGVSWLPLYTGNVIDSAFPNDYITSLHLSADASTIIVTTKRKIFRSTDGGLGFTMVQYFGTTVAAMGKSPKYTNLAWSSDNILIASAGNGNVLYSYNAGASWINTVGMIPPTTIDSKSGSTLFQGFTTSGAPVGFFNSDADETIYRLEQVNLTTFTASVSDTYEKSVLAMTSSVADVTCYVLTPCGQTGDILIASNTEFSSYLDGFVNIDGSCFYVTESEDCSNTIHVVYSNIISVANCAACDPPEPIYALRDCIALEQTQYTTEALTPGISGYIGQVLYIAGYPNTCWIVVEVSGDSPQAITILNNFGTCPDCASQLPGPPPVYELTNCLDPLDILYTYNSQFAEPAELEQVVKITQDTDPRSCWKVAEIPFDDQAISNLTIYVDEEGVLQIFKDCECCLPAPDPAPIKYTRVIPKPDRKFYQIQQSQCDITANIRFADGYYRLFKELKYGISNQCDGINLERLWIKKNLSDLAVINDPTACIITTPVVPVICPEPSGNPFIPPPPPITYTFTVGAYGVDPGTFGCTQCLDGSAPSGGANLCPQFNLVLDYNILDSLDPFSAYVFNYNGNCLWAIGFTIVAGSDPTFQTYTMTSANITSIVLEDGVLPCLLCGG